MSLHGIGGPRRPSREQKLPEEQAGVSAPSTVTVTVTPGEPPAEQAAVALERPLAAPKTSAPVALAPVAGRLPLKLQMANAVRSVDGGERVLGVRRSFTGQVVEQGGQLFVRDPYAKGRADLARLEGAPLAPGAVVQVAVVDEGGAPVARVEGQPLAAAGSAKAAMYEIAARHGLDPTFPPAVMKEVAELVASPGLDDPKLVDLTEKAFITIDNVDSRDLDQAMFLEKNPATGGYTAWYALADGAYYVRPGSALFDEAKKRGTSFYLPGLSVPMLPKELSEGLVSLNEGVERRSLVFRIELDEHGVQTKSEVLRAKIRSRKKLSYEGVQRYHDKLAQGGGALDGVHHGKDFSETLALLKDIGEKRIARAAEHDVVQHRRHPVKVGFKESDGLTFSLMGEPRNDVERWNEQISLLCNVEGAKLLKDASGLDPTTAPPNLQGIFRAHDAPSVGRVRDLERFIHDLVDEAGLDESWRWRRASESLASYLRRLPDDGPHRRVALAIHRQAMVINSASELKATPSKHHGIGADAYARFSSPMREVVGIFTHKEALEVLEGKAHEAPTFDDVTLQREIIEAGNRAKQVQSAITKEANKLAIDALLAPDLSVSHDERPARAGTVMGVTGDKVYVQLDDPPIELKVYLKDLAHLAGKRFTTDADQVMLQGDDGRVCLVGDEVRVRVHGYDEAARRWQLDLV